MGYINLKHNSVNKSHNSSLNPTSMQQQLQPNLLFTTESFKCVRHKNISTYKSTSSI